MKILIAFDWFLKLVVEGQAHALRDMGHDVRLLCRDHALEFDGRVAERAKILKELKAHGIDVLEVPGKRYSIGERRALLGIRRHVQAWGPDVVSAHQNNDPRLRWLVRGFPVVFTVHDPRPHPGHMSKPRERLGEAVWMRSATRVVVHGEQLVSKLPRSVRRDQVRVIPHGIDVEDSPQPPPEALAVLLFGRLEPYKGIDILAKAMREVWSTAPAVRLLVAGRGPAIGDVPDDSRVELREGYIPESEIPHLLGEASVVALPYTEASQSGVGLLSIAHGVPIVVTRTGALAELAIEERFVASPGNPAELADRLLWALRDGASQRNAILHFARRKFSWPVVAESYTEVFDEVRPRSANPSSQRQNLTGLGTE